MFLDRKDAGTRLAARIASRNEPDPVVLALPRGGVPVALEIARALKAPLDVVFVRKVGAPGQPELALGAVVDGPEPVSVANEDVMAWFDVGREEFDRRAAMEVAEIARRKERYAIPGRQPIEVAGRTAIVVDDGLATGVTARAALRAVRARGPRRLILAVPVAPPETLIDLKHDADDIIYLDSPSFFQAVGAYYEDFSQVSDDEVVDMLRQSDSLGARGPSTDRS